MVAPSQLGQDGVSNVNRLSSEPFGVFPVPKVGIYACGAAGLAIALDFNRRSGELAKVYAPPEHPGCSRAARQQADIESYMAMEGRFNADFETDLGVFVASCQWIFVASDTGGHQAIIESMMPYKAHLNGTIFVWITGVGTGVVAHEQLEPHNTFETSQLQYTCRVEQSNDEVKLRMNGFKERVVAVSYHKRDDQTLAALNAILGMPVDLESSPSFLDILFVGNHGYVHPSTMLRNRQAIENGWRLLLYHQLMTREVCQEMLDAWAQLCDLARALHLSEPEHPVEVFNKDYGTNYDLTLDGLKAFVTQCEALNRKPGLPGSMRARQLDQEITFICPLWVSLARAVGVNLSVVEGWINDANEINKKNYWETARTLAYYGLPEDATIDAIRNRFRASYFLAKGPLALT